ncbi:MAG: hypothetical protein KF841_17015 [Phycisphaerae bacterium]|nr:hypothetical protein [Phycisphaerae bacterium]
MSNDQSETRLTIVAAFGIAVILATYLNLTRVPAVFWLTPLTENIRTADGRSVIPDPGEQLTHVYLPDPDNDLRVFRAKEVAEGRLRCWDIMSQINAPAGVRLHWTSPMDYLTAGAGLIGEYVLGGPDGFVTGAALVAPAVGVAYLAVLIGLVAQLGGGLAALICGAACAASPAFLRVFGLGNVDHHCLIELLLAIATLALINGARRMADRIASAPRHDDARGLNSADSSVGRANPRGTPAGTIKELACFALSGLMIGVAIWTATQVILFWSIIFGVLCITVAAGRSESRWALFHAATVWTGGALIAVIVGFVIDGRHEWAAMPVDRISLFHVGATLLGLLVIRVIGPGTARGGSSAAGTRVGRTLPAILGIAVLVVVAVKSESVLAPVRGDALARWHERVAELQPLIRFTGEMELSARLAPMHERLGFLPYLLIIAFPTFLIARRVPLWIRFLLGLFAFTISVLSIVQLRWIDHYGTFALPVIVVGLLESTHRIGHWIKGFSLVWRGSLVASAIGVSSIPFSVWPTLALIWRAGDVAARAPSGLNPESAALLDAIGPREDQKRTALTAMAIRRTEMLNPASSARRNILCEEGEGPTLLRETGLPVVAAPYHRAISGIVEMMRFFAERDPAAARARLDRLGVRYIVAPYRANEQLMHFEQIAFGELRSYDPPIDSYDARGALRQTLRYRPEVNRTMAYRLAVQPYDHGIEGVELLYGICDDPSQPGAIHGLLFIVHETAIPTTAQAMSGTP